MANYSGSRWISAIGFLFLIAIAFLLSENRKKINYRTVAWGIGLQFLAFFLVIGIPGLGVGGPFKFVFNGANDFVNAIIEYTGEGTKFLFGPLSDTKQWGGIIFAIHILPTIVFTATLMAVFYHIGIMQKIVRVMAWCMYRTMRVSGAESLSNAANVFLGQTEAPLVIKPYIDGMTRSELLAIMVGGMASTAGGVLVAYVSFLNEMIPDIAGHLLGASVLSAPASFCIAKILIPETEKPETLGELPKDSVALDSNIFEAAARGASEGLQLALNVGAMLLAFIALIALVNGALSHLGGLSMQQIFAWVFKPFAFLMGVPWDEAARAGTLLGEKTVFNEFVAYMHLAQAKDLSVRSTTILAYALCGFANFSSIGIQIGGIGFMAPKKKSEIAKLGLISLIGGNLATFMTACIAGILI